MKTADQTDFQIRLLANAPVLYLARHIQPFYPEHPGLPKMPGLLPDKTKSHAPKVKLMSFNAPIGFSSTLEPIFVA